MSLKIVRTNEAEWKPAIDHGKFSQRRKALSVGGEKISAGMWELAPGKVSFPLHRHYATEEALLVISGHAKIRTPEGQHEIGPGDWVTFPAGGVAHQLINEGEAPMVYLALSTGVGVDVVEYPDSGKIACSVAGEKGKRAVFQESNQAGYFDGEE